MRGVPVTRWFSNFELKKKLDAMPRFEEFKPSPALLKSSLRSRALEYPRIAALHGVSYVADPTKSKAERICWFICIVASTITAMAIIVTLMERFNTDPMLDSLEIEHDDSPLTLPRIYLCPLWQPFDKEELGDFIYRRLYNWDLSRALWSNITRNDDFDDSVLPTTVFKRNSLPCDYFIQNSTLKDILSLISHLPIPMHLANAHREIQVKVAHRTCKDLWLNCSSFESVWTNGGNCFVAPSMGVIIHDMEIEFAFNITSYPMRVYATLLEDREFLRNLPFHGFILPSYVSMALQETFTSPYAKILTRSQRNCFFPGEQLPYVKCVLNCQVKNSLKYCNCVPWYLANGGEKECPISRYDCLSRNSAKIIDISACHCRQSCNNIVFDKRQPELRPAGGACGIKIVGKSKLKFKRTVRFGLVDLFISFGGIAGLFLGCSILSTIELGYYFTLRTYCGAVLDAPKRRYIITKINVLDTAQPVNLTRTQKRRFSIRKNEALHDYIN